MILGIDIGGTKVAAGLVKDGAIVERRIAPSLVYGDCQKIPQQLNELCGDWMDSVSAIGIASAGLVSENDVCFVSRKGHPTVDLRQPIKERSGIPVVLLNDAWAGALGEYSTGRFESTETVAYVTISTGIGGGVVHKGELLTSANGLMAHFGHSVVSSAPDPDNTCHSSRRNCVESLASGAALARRATHMKGRSVDTREIFENAANDPEFSALLDNAAELIAELFTNIRAFLSADVVIMGGSVGLAPGFKERIERVLYLHPPVWRVSLKRATLGANAEIIGAATAAQNYLNAQLLHAV